MKTAIVTGAAKRIGKVIADRLLKEGYHTLLHANTSHEELKTWVKSHPNRNQVLDTVYADLSTEIGQTNLISAAKKILVALDLLVHNASTFYPKEFASVTRMDLREMLSVNLEAPYFVTQGLLEELYRAKNPSVINIGDAMWQRPSPKFSHYAVSKAGLFILTRALANELSPRIRVNAVAPGAIMFQKFQTEETRTCILERIPYGKLGSPEDIADAVIYLSEKARYAVGETIVIDGGRSIA